MVSISEALRPLLVPVLLLILSLAGTGDARGAEGYPLPADYPGFPFPVRQTVQDPPARYELDLNPGLDAENQRLADEMQRMANDPARLALKIPLVLLLEYTGLATPGGWGWLGTQKPNFIAGEAVVAVAMKFLNSDPLPRVAGTIAFESHLHTQCSHDSAADLESMLIHAAAKGLQAVAVTDHNMIACAWRAVGVAAELRSQGRLPPDFIVVVGEEIGTSQGHVIGLFLQRYISPDMTAAETIREIHDQGGLAVAPHQGEGGTYLAPSLVRNLPFDAVEMGSGALFLPFDFYYLLKEGGSSSKPRLFGMDTHYSRLPGWLGYNRATVREPTAPALKDAIRRGATEPVFNGIYAGYRRLIERPTIFGAYQAGSFYFTLRDWLDDHIARLIRADGFVISTGYERPLRDLLNIVSAVGVVQDYVDEKGVFGTGPQISVAATYGALSLGYAKMGTDAPHQVFLEYRRGF
jgi:hypothetical protein